jgi:hypothetical protein
MDIEELNALSVRDLITRKQQLLEEVVEIDEILLRRIVEEAK